MYYRRKILLGLIQKFGGSVTNTDLQRYLFLLNQDMGLPVYEFIPNNPGCYSFQANQDLSTLTKYKIVKESEGLWKLANKTSYLNQIIADDRNLIEKFYTRFNELKGDDLTKYIFENYPYYGIYSPDAERLLSPKRYKMVMDKIPHSTTQTIFTIGYEGKSVEFYTNQLIKADVKVLCDIRRNPLSMKYGFSKSQLKTVVESTGIKYIHLPELGIASEKRQELKAKSDYNKLFSEYEKHILKNELEGLEKVYQLLVSNKRIALTCFEADPNRCHRSRTVKALSVKFENNYNIKHI
jgi:hypothetical protein